MCVCVFAPARVCDCVSLSVDLSPRQWELLSSQSGVTGWTCLMDLFRQEHTTTRLHSFCRPLICFLERSTHVVLRVEFHWPAVSMENRLSDSFSFCLSVCLSYTCAVCTSHLISLFPFLHKSFEWVSYHLSLCPSPSFPLHLLECQWVWLFLLL